MLDMSQDTGITHLFINPLDKDSSFPFPQPTFVRLWFSPATPHPPGTPGDPAFLLRPCTFLLSSSLAYTHVCRNFSFNPGCLSGPGVLTLPPTVRQWPGSTGRGKRRWLLTLVPRWPVFPLPILTALVPDQPFPWGPGLISNPIFCHKTSFLSVLAAGFCHFQPGKSFFQTDPRVWGHLRVEGASSCALSHVST